MAHIATLQAKEDLATARYRINQQANDITERDNTISELQTELARLRQGQQPPVTPVPQKEIRSDLTAMARVLTQNIYRLAAEAIRHRRTAQCMTAQEVYNYIHICRHHAKVKNCGCMTEAASDLRPAGAEWVPIQTEETEALAEEILGSAILSQHMPRKQLSGIRA